MLKHPLVPILFAFVAGFAGAAAFTHWGPAPKPQVITVRGGAANPTTVARLAAEQWPELEQREVDALTVELKRVSVGARQEVVIFCLDDVKCGDLALNLENAFESAHWQVSRQQPLADATYGIGTTSNILANALTTATSLKAPEIIEANLHNQIALVIGRRPKEGSMPFVPIP